MAPPLEILSYGLAFGVAVAAIGVGIGVGAGIARMLWHEAEEHHISRRANGGGR